MGLHAFQWLALLSALMTLLLLADALAGHYRSGFAFRVQYAPFISGGLMIIAAVAVALVPGVTWLNTTLRFAGWLTVASGLIGFVFNHPKGKAKKPGGNKRLLHYLM